MQDSGRVIQVQQLAGLPWETPGHRNKPGPLYGALMLDDNGEPVAVVVHTKGEPVAVPGLNIADVQPARHGMKEVTYVTSSPDPCPAVRPGQGCYFHMGE